MLNKIKNNKKKIVFLCLTLLIILSSIVYIVIKQSNENTNHLVLQGKIKSVDVEVTDYKNEYTEDQFINQEKDNLDELINISDCSEEFMRKYFESIKRITEDNHTENILIVMSKEKINETYGAIDVVEAPNHQYFIKYNSETDKNNAFEKLKKDDKILHVNSNNLYTILESSFNSWGIEKMGLDKSIDKANEKYSNSLLNDVTVAIIDTGCDMNLFNENYNGKISQIYNAYDGDGMYDSNGHGTHIAGTIAEGTSDNVNVLPIKVSDSKTMDDIRVITAINYLTYYKKADVINMSFGSYNFDESLYVAIESARNSGIISVAAAGNEDKSENSYPAAYDNTISISAVDSDLNKADFSNYGSTITFAAPGTNILSINGIKSGTSMATPHAVCAVALLKSIDTDLSLEEVITILKNTAIDLGAPGKDDIFGYGLIDVSDYDELYLIAENTNIIDFEVEVESAIEWQYCNITNLMNLKIKLKDQNGNEYVKLFSDVDDLIIENYDPFFIGEQQILIKYNGIEKNITIDNDVSYSAYQLRYCDDFHTQCRINNFCTNIPKKVYIPEYIDNMKVIGITPIIFNDTGVETIILPNSINRIDEDCFKNNTSLKAIKGGPAEIAISDNAFLGAYNLRTFEPKISSLGKSAFEDAKGLDNIILSDNIEVLEEATFKNCNNLENINIPNNLKEIKSEALAYTKIKSLHIPQTLTQISADGLLGISGLEEIKVDEENQRFDSRENCNCLIETSTNTLLVGSANSVIPDSVTEIFMYAFYNNSKIKKIDTNKVNTIGDGAFQCCANLEEVYLTSSVITIQNNIFKNSSKTVIYLYNNDLETDFFNWSQEKDSFWGFICVIPEENGINVDTKTQYRAFDKVSDLNINLRYIGLISSHTDSLKVDLDEKIIEGYTITYENGSDHFIYGDTYFTVSAVTKYGVEINKIVEVSIQKALPNYVIPSKLEAKIGQNLSNIELPNNFEWMNGDEVINESGEVIFKARYIPEDITNYEIVENIDIPVIVENEKTVINPEIFLNEKIYDGTEQLNISDITVSNLEVSDYSIVSAVLSSADIGERTATIKLRLSDEKYEEYSFDNGKQEKEFVVDVNVLPLELIKPTLVEKEYVYNDTEQIIELKNFDKEKMNITGNIRKNAGEQIVTISLKNDNYIWKDGTRNNIEFTFNIKKADSNIKYNASDMIYKYDEQFYGIELNVVSPSNAVIKYANKDDEYVLDEMPKYNEIGTYKIKYRIYINDNYTDIFGENTLVIVEDYVIGDINGDGKVNIKDWNKLYNHINETEILEGYQLICADINKDGKVNIKDWNRMYDHITEVNPLW